MSQHTSTLDQPLGLAGTNAPRPARTTPTGLARPVGSDRPRRTQTAQEPPPCGATLEARLDDLLARVAVRDRVAEAALPGPRDFLGWPSWSMDSGLTPPQEAFVELWSPRLVLDESHALRELLTTLRWWLAAHEDDDTVHEALSRFATSTAPVGDPS